MLKDNLGHPAAISAPFGPAAQQDISKKSIHASAGEAQRYAARQQVQLWRKRALCYSFRAILMSLLGLSVWVYAAQETNDNKSPTVSAGHRDAREVAEVLATTLDEKQEKLNQAISALDEAQQKTLLLKAQVEQLQEKLQAITTAQQ